MRNGLPKSGPLINESAIVNLDSKDQEGTHWVCYKKRGNHVDSYGNLKSFNELLKYLGLNMTIRYNYRRYQKFNSFIVVTFAYNFFQITRLSVLLTTMSLTFTLTSDETILSADFSPPLDLSVGDWVIGLIDFPSYNSIPNVIEGKNKLYYYEGNDLKNIKIPHGTYEIDDLNDYIQSVVGDPDYHE